MYNLHSHSLLSDGALLPSELAMRHLAAGYQVLAITDHADYSNIKNIVPAILEFTRHWPKTLDLKVLPGIELTHIPPDQFKSLTRYARQNGIKIIVGHGETPAEPVLKGTNKAALEADVDILAHPGNLSDEDLKLAAKKGIFLEITTRDGHKETNASVVQKALHAGAKLILNTDCHAPEDIIRPERIADLARASGLTPEHITKINEDVKSFLKTKGIA